MMRFWQLEDAEVVGLWLIFNTIDLGMKRDVYIRQIDSMHFRVTSSRYDC